MAYNYQRPDPKVLFRNWLKYQSELIGVAVQEGFTREEAIEMLKVYCLNGIEGNIGSA